MAKWDYNPSYKGISPFITGRGAHFVQIRTKSKYHKFAPLKSSFSQNNPRIFWYSNQKFGWNPTWTAKTRRAGQRMYNVSNDVLISN